MSQGDLYDFNLRASLARHVSASTFVTTHGYTVDFGDAVFNPNALARWVTFEFVGSTGTVLTQNILHARCFSRAINDRFGRERELMIGRLRSMLSVSGGILLYDYTTDAAHPAKIQHNGTDIYMAVRFGNRGPLLDADSFGESSGNLSGVHLVVLTYNVYVGRPSEQW